MIVIHINVLIAIANRLYEKKIEIMLLFMRQNKIIKYV